MLSEGARKCRRVHGGKKCLCVVWSIQKQPYASRQAAALCPCLGARARALHSLQHSTPLTAPGLSAPQPLPSSSWIRVPCSHTELGQLGSAQPPPQHTGSAPHPSAAQPLSTATGAGGPADARVV